MKSLLSSMLSVVLFSVSILGASEAFDLNESKIYTPASRIYMNDSKIFYVTENLDLISAESVGADEDGIYVIIPSMKNGDWICSYCRAPNTVANRYCYKCERGR